MSDSLSTVWNAMTSNGMFEVQEIEIRGVPTRSYVNVPTSVVDIFAGTVATKPDQPYLVFADERYTYGEVGALVDKAAIGLASLGVSQGDTVAIFGNMNGVTTKSGNEIGDFTFALRAKVRNGQVVLWNWFEDSYAVSQAYHGN